MAERPVVMVSSTILNLPEHRPQVRDACLRLGMFPLMMEHLPASDVDAIAESLRMVDRSDVYVGVFGHRYGHVPEGHERSITEMEVDRALERDIPRCLFFMARNHPVTIEDVDTGANAERLKRLKERLGKTHVVLEFASPADLRANVIHSLSELRQPSPGELHYISDIPTAPAPYIAHPYTLLQTKDLIGRQAELNLLTDWVAKPGTEVHEARILSMVAIGGMGKSALTWKWFNDVASQEMRPLAGRLWWSFYESDARFENLIARALAYVTGQPSAEIDRLSLAEQQTRLLQALDREPFLLVLDGLERILIAYARPDAAYLGDDDLEDRDLAGADSLPAQLTGQHRLRRTADPRAGLFLQRLAQVQASRILVSTRLYPADLQTVTGNPLPGSTVHFLEGLTDDDALNLWRALGVSGSRDELVALFNSFGNYPLLIRALAGEVAGYRAAPGDFDQWLVAHPGFNPFGLELVQSKSHVLAFALRGLSEADAEVLHTIAAFRMPASYDTLVALLVGPGKINSDERALDAILSDLEDRGLLGWDRRANRYDQHPIVRGVAWHGVSPENQRSVYETLAKYFDSIPKIDDANVESLEDLTAAIELYNALIQLGRWEAAYDLMGDYLTEVIPRLSAWREFGQLAKAFVDTSGELPEGERSLKVAPLLVLAISEHFAGNPEHALSSYRETIDLWLREEKEVSLFYDGEQGSSGLVFGLYAAALSLTGALRAAEKTARQALIAGRNVPPERNDADIAQIILARVLSIRGEHDSAERLLQKEVTWDWQGVAQVGLDPSLESATVALAQRNPSAAAQYLNSALERAPQGESIKTRIRALLLRGTTALQLGALEKADELIHDAVQQARLHHLLAEEVDSLLELARLHHSRGEHDSARQVLRDLSELTELGHYELTKADALNLLSELERDVGNHEAAVIAATEAYRTAWCDGPPFSYHTALEHARAHVAALDASAWEQLERYQPHPRGEAEEARSDDIRALRHRAISHSDPSVREGMLCRIAMDWTEYPETLPLLQQRATDDSSAAVRSTVLRLIAAGWPDNPDTRRLLIELERNDSAGEVREVAHQLLTR
jgi:hypothetical protein